MVRKLLSPSVWEPAVHPSYSAPIGLTKTRQVTGKGSNLPGPHHLLSDWEPARSQVPLRNNGATLPPGRCQTLYP